MNGVPDTNCLIRIRRLNPEMSSPHCWTLTTGEVGMTSQVMGLAEAVGLPFTHHTMDIKPPWRWLPGQFCPGLLRFGLEPQNTTLAPPWPDLLISCGRRSAAVALAIKRRSAGRTRTVHIQDPKLPPHYFDWVVPPLHDGLTGPNVWPTRGALHRVTPATLRAAAHAQAHRFAHLPPAWVGVLLGGATRHAQTASHQIEQLGQQLAQWALQYGLGVVLTPSRRTAPEHLELLRTTLQATPHFIWDGVGENPYFAILARARALVVTGDSVSMVSEAASTGKPLYVAHLSTYGRRLSRFHQQLAAEGVTRPFPSEWAQWTYEPVNDTPEVARFLRAQLGLVSAE